MQMSHHAGLTGSVPAALYLDSGGGAAYPPVILICEAAQAKRPPRLLQVPMQVPYCNQARNRRQHRGVCFVLQHTEGCCSVLAGERWQVQGVDERRTGSLPADHAVKVWRGPERWRGPRSNL